MINLQDVMEIQIILLHVKNVKIIAELVVVQMVVHLNIMNWDV